MVLPNSMLDSIISMRYFLFLIIISLVYSSSAFAEVPPVKLEGVSVHLFLEKSGVFSEDITSIPGFWTRNFSPSVMSSIPQDENFHSFIIKLKFTAPHEVFIPSEIAQVRILSEKTHKTLLKKSIHNLYVKFPDPSYIPIFVDGHECEPMIIQSKSFDTTIVKKLSFHCGE